VLLTVDLTRAVADEAIERKDSVVIAYRMSKGLGKASLTIIDPIIFRGLKSLTLGDPQQQSLLRLALEGISVRIFLLAVSI
jgi:putative NIF3 family GTP cyclohydrolase 1 type 2